MRRKAVSGIMLALLLIGMLTLAFDIQIVKGETIDRVDSVVLKFDFPSSIVTEGSIYDSVTMLGLPQHGAPGEPILPFKIVKALIPQGNDVQSVDVTAGDRRVLEGSFNVAYGKTPIPISSNMTPVDQPNQAIYSSANPFPNVLFSQMSEQYLRGYEILLLKLHPVQYVPKTGEVSYFETMTVTINIKETGTTSPFFRNLPRDRALVLDIVDNPNEVNTYTKTVTRMQPTTLVDPSYSYDYVIITNSDLKSSFQPLMDWKIQKGLNATIVLVEDIMNDPDYHCDGSFGDGCSTARFNDTQAHIRNFIKDAFQNWGTEYVLLGGDDEIIPSRGVYVYQGYYTDYNIPCDMYYGTLDQSWDKDNDTIFGEAVYYYSEPENGTAGEEADFFAEVYIGRATVDNAEEATNFVSKTLAYEQNTDTTYLKKALMIGETLDYWTEGGNGKDLVTDIIPQYTTTRLYDRDGTFSRAAVINEINNGPHIINHVGHASYTTVMGLDTWDVGNLTNTECFMAYSIGCYSAAFDEATSGSNEAIAEHFISNLHGAFAYIGNSRYGWYIRGSTSGPGDQYDRSFFDVLNDGIRNVGKALQLSKEQEPSFHRWTYFTLNLLGDPEVEIVTDITAPIAHFETTTYLLTPPCIEGLVNLRGTAKRGAAVGSTFSNFTIEFGCGTNPTSWTTTGINLTNNGESEVVNGILAIWNTSLVDDGTYTLRLTVSDIDGNVGEDWVVIVVDNILSVHNIDTGLNYGTIQEAINAPETLDGHTILVDEGIYYEHVIVNKALSLVGENRSTTIIDGRGTGGIFSVEASNVLIGNFTIRNGDYSVYVARTRNVTIRNNDITNNFGGIRLDWSSNNIISGNDITANILEGIFFWDSSDNIISGNNISNNLEGIMLDWSSNNIISGNDITANILEGIWLDNCSNNTISGNGIMNNEQGIYLAWSLNNTVSGNNITENNEYGIWLRESSNNTVSGNNITNNSEYGIYLYESSSNILSGNNIAANNEYGIWLRYLSRNNTIYENNITNNWIGISLSTSSNNIIYHNNFVNNSGQVYSGASTNVWDDGYSSGGNYWSDHVCTGNPSDGSQPYIIGINNVDHYPFQDPNGWLLNGLNVTSSPITGITFTINGTPQTTPHIEWLPEDSYTVEMPEAHDGYIWSHWLEDGDTNRTKTVTLNTTVTLTAYYRMIEDLNDDGIIDIEDIIMAALAFGSYPDHPRWNPIADINQDGIIDIEDIASIAINFGKTA